MTVFILSDAYIGQMVEPIVLPELVKRNMRKKWAVCGDRESRNSLITSIFMQQEILSDLNLRLQEKYDLIEKELVEFEETGTNDAEVLFVAYGISARICLSALKSLRENGIKAGLFRLKTLFPFPRAPLHALANKVRACIAVEFANGQMAEDVERAVKAQCPVLRYNWYGGIIPSIREIVDRVTCDMSGTSL
jgi:2-oxoisovalerate ferredoxin oxidoreductase alpha subunit